MEQKTQVRINVDRTEQNDLKGDNYLSFCTADVKIPKLDVKEFWLRIKKNNEEKGLIMIPCMEFDNAILKKFKATKIIDIDGNKTRWNIEYDHDCISTNTPIKFSWQGSLDSIPELTTLQFAATILNFNDIKFEFSKDNGEWKSLETSGGGDPKVGDPEVERWTWVHKKIKETVSKSGIYPQFHPKQCATITALNYDSIKNKTLTYIGPDDIANLLTALQTITEKENYPEQPLEKLVIRSLKGGDKPAETESFEQLIKEIMRDASIKHKRHQDDWDDDNDLIIDTYTAMAWGKSDEEVTTELKNRVNALNENGRLILVYPEEEEIFFLQDNKCPEWLNKKIDQTRKGDLVLDGIKLEHFSTLNNSKYAIFSKSDKKLREPSKPSPNFKGEELGTDNTHTKEQKSLWTDKKPQETVRITTNDEQLPVRITTWDEYCRQCSRRNTGSIPGRPFKLPVVEKIRHHLKTLQFPKNTITIQSHPGWGKTSIIGEVLFPSKNQSTEKIRFGSLNQFEYFIKSVNSDEVRKSILVLDDLHNEFTTEDHKNEKTDIIDRIIKIASDVQALFITCRFDEWEGELFKDIMDINEAFDTGLFTEWDDPRCQDFVQHLMDRAGCLVEETDEMYEVSKKWAKYIFQKLFSVHNYQSKGKAFSPRDAISKLTEERYKFYDLSDSYEFRENDKLDDDEFSMFGM